MKKIIDIGFGVTETETEFLNEIRNAIKNSNKLNKLQVEKLAAKFNIFNKNYVKELTELAIVQIAREIAHSKNLSLREKYDRIVEVYYNQVNLSHRTSHSMMLQQYSTPAPIAFLSSNYIYKGRTGMYFEPSAGNGLLTIAIPYNQIEVNEVDDIRLSNLKSQPFRKVTNKDASKSFFMPETYDGIVTNPPFGTLDEPQLFGQWKIKTLDHAMALHALNTMKDDGKAAIIIGGHTKWDEKGRIQAGKNRIFFNYLYSHYHVEDVILIDGHKLYSRQGTAFDTRLILIDGRKEIVEGVAPLKTTIGSTVVKSFDELYARIVGDNDKTEAKRLFEKRSKELIDETLINMKLNKQNKIKLKLKLQKAKLALLGDEQILGIEDDIKINKQIIMYKRELLNNDFVFDMGKPDEFLIKYGIPNKQIRMRYDVLEKAINKHKILAEEFKNFNKKINNPKAIYKSKTHPNTSKLILTELKNIMENPVVVAIWTNKNNVINDITTVHAKFRRQLRNWENEGLTLYKKRNFEI